MRLTERRLARLERLIRRRSGPQRMVWVINEGDPPPIGVQPEDLVIALRAGFLPPEAADRIGADELVIEYAEDWRNVGS